MQLVSVLGSDFQVNSENEWKWHLYTYRQASYNTQQSDTTERLSLHIPTDPSLKGCETDLQPFMYHRINYMKQYFY